MNSIGEECTNLKRNYEDCFNKWFSEKFLKGNNEDDCAPLFKVYQTCVKKAIKEKNLDLDCMEKDVLGTEFEKPPPPVSK
ncbi:hypothetical protein SNE40_002074 [Patella caerulea]|uniref:TP53-regulated inhibitor of apoptosis 1 n=1 Tax=Patella caerulea TaxID=87958 RepID=A0AAN8PYN2_PATCE